MHRWLATTLIAISVAASPAAAQPVPEGPPSRTLERAIKLYDKKDFLSASIELDKVVSGEAGDDPVNLQRAEFFVAKTMYQLGFYATALAQLDKIAKTGGHRYRMPILKWLVAIQRAVPAGAAVRAPARAFVGETELGPELASVGDEVAYAIGVEAAAIENVGAASLWLSRVPVGSPLHGRAQLALARMRFAQRDLETGAQYALAAARDPQLADRVAIELATAGHRLGQPARVHHALEQLVPTTPRAAFETSRLDVEAQLPELAKLPVASFTAAILAAVCSHDATSNALPAIAAAVREARPAIDPLLAGDDDARVYESITQQLATLPAAVRFALADEELRDAVTWVDELRRERGLFDRTDRAWQTAPVGARVLEDLALQLGLAEAAAGKLYRERLARLRDDLDPIGVVLGASSAPLAVGPGVPLGRGFVIARAMCATAAAAQVGSSPATVAATQGRGCAGCAGGGAGGSLALTSLVLLALRAGRRRS